MDYVRSDQQWFQFKDDWLPTKEKKWNAVHSPTPSDFEEADDLMLEVLGHTRRSYIDQLIEENKDLKLQLTQAREEICKVKHERKQLQRILRQMNESDEETAPISNNIPSERLDCSRRSSLCVDGEALIRKLEVLSATNAELEEKVSRLSEDKQSLADEVEQLKQHLSELNRRLKGAEMLQNTLIAREEDNDQLEKENVDQKQRICQLEACNRKWATENEELECQLRRKKEDVIDLKRKLREMENWYQEYRALLEEQKAANASLRHEHRPKILRHVSTPNSPYVSTQSVSSEIEESIRIRRRSRHYSENVMQNRNVLNMIHLVSLARGSHRHTIGNGYSLLCNYNYNNNCDDQKCESVTSESTDINAEQSEEETDPFETFRQNISFVPLGCPGRPGSFDLELALGFKVQLSPLQTGQLVDLFDDDEDDDESRTDEESVVNGTSTPRCPSSPSCRCDKLQLVKPLEGSVTLLQWRRLSVPGLGNILDSRDGIQVKGDETENYFEQADHSLSDCEEDDDSMLTPNPKERSDVKTSENESNPSSSKSSKVSPTCDMTSNDNSSERKTHKNSGKGKQSRDREMFILFGPTRVPLSNLVPQSQQNEDEFSKKRIGCVIA